jgi:septum formation protein
LEKVMALWLAPQPLVLASRSDARRSLLEAAGIPVELAAADLDEREVEARAGPLSASDAAAVLAREKARVCARQKPGRIVIGADQTLAVGSQRLSKPPDRATARAQLRALAGRSHELHSAVAVARDERIVFSHVEAARLAVRPISDRFIDTYLDAVGSQGRP